ncbi:MAG TPA: peptidylprolyl isomerase [Nitrospiraceae bacterium]|nr:peptidylprolyl isomerase [Nitrospiraceae bacterium]
MTQRIRNFIILLTTPFLIFCFMSIARGESEAEKGNEIKDRIIVARVNGEPIYKEALAPYMQQEMKKFKKYGMTRKASPEVEKRMEMRALERVIDQEIIIQESQKIKIDDIDKKVDEGVNKIKSKYKTEELFNAFLASKKLTENDLRENVRKQIYMDTYLEKNGVRNPVIPEEEMKKFYEESKDSFRTEEYVRASHILIKADENASQEEKDAARKKAETIRAEIVSGKDFAPMAREFSEDGRAANGGNLDYITRGYMPPEFDLVAFAMKKDEVSEVVQTKFGFHIIKVFDKKPGGIPPYEEMRDFIEKYLQQEETKKKLASHMAELKTKAKIEVLLDQTAPDK